MTINLEKWAELAEHTIKEAEHKSSDPLWQKDALDLMTALAKNQSPTQGSTRQEYFGKLRHAYEQATGDRLYGHILA